MRRFCSHLQTALCLFQYSKKVRILRIKILLHLKTTKKQKIGPFRKPNSKWGQFFVKKQRTVCKCRKNREENVQDFVAAHSFVAVSKRLKSMHFNLNYGSLKKILFCELPKLFLRIYKQPNVSTLRIPHPFFAYGCNKQLPMLKRMKTAGFLKL